MRERGEIESLMKNSWKIWSGIHHYIPVQSTLVYDICIQIQLDDLSQNCLKNCFMQNMKVLFTELSFIALNSFSSKKPCLYRPRLILEGPAGRGQTTHLGPALLHHLEHLSVHLLDLSTMFCVSTRSPEEACAHVSWGFMFGWFE